MKTAAEKPFVRVILTVSLLTGFACAHNKPDLAKTISQQPVVAITDAKLGDAAIAFLATSKTQDVALYETRRRTFEELLTDYLAEHQVDAPVTLELQHDQMTFVFPLRLIFKNTALGKGWRVLDATPSWEPVGPRLRGEILDLALLVRDKRAPSVAALFSDSLVTMSLMNGAEFSPAIFRFRDAGVPARRSLFPAGRLQVDASSPTGKIDIVAQVSTMRSPVAATLGAGRLELRRDNHSASVWPDTVSSTEESDDLFCCLPDSLSPFRSLYKIKGSDLIVFLDQNGFLRLQSSDGAEPVWSSSRPWGSRLALLDSNIVAVSDARQSSFVGFKLEGEEGRLVGHSPTLPGSVTAMMPYHANNLAGLLVSASQPDISGIAWSQLYFMSYDEFRWQLPVHYAQPTFPQYDANLTLVLEKLEWSADIHDRFGLPVTVWVNTVETLVERGETDPILKLAQNVAPDSTGLIWEIRLTPGVRFADGSSVTAQSVIDGWKAMFRNCQSNDCSSAWQWLAIEGAGEFVAGQHDEIAGLQAVDSLTLRLTLSEPQPDFHELLTQPGFGVLKVNSHGELLGTGPFRIEGFNLRRRSVSLTCTKNAYYHSAQAALNAIHVQRLSASVVDALARQANGLTIVQRQKDLKYFRSLAAFSTRPFPIEPIYFLALNPDDRTLGNAQMRQHIATAVVERQVISDIVTEAESTPASALFGRKKMVVSPEGRQSYTSRRLRIAYDRGDEVARQIAERLAARLSQLRVSRVSLSSLSNSAFSALRQQGNYDILVDSIQPTFHLPRHNLMQLLNRGYRVEPSALVQKRQILSQSDATAAAALEESLIEQAVFIPLIRIKQFAVLPAKLLDAKLVGAAGIDLSRAWMSKN